MTPNHQAPDIDRVLKRNRSARTRHVVGRLALGVGLFAVPFVATRLGYDGALPFFCLPVALWVILFLLLRLRHGSRLGVCEKVLRTYPLEYRTQVSRKGTQWQYLGSVHTVRLSARGEHGAPLLRALNASTARRWPEAAEESGAWFAGDLAFGGVVILPGTGDLLFVQPAEWKKYEKERSEAAPERRALAERAGISRLLEKEPRMISVYGG